MRIAANLYVLTPKPLVGGACRTAGIEVGEPQIKLPACHSSRQAGRAELLVRGASAGPPSGPWPGASPTLCQLWARQSGRLVAVTRRFQPIAYGAPATSVPPRHPHHPPHRAAAERAAGLPAR
jgi:hypothetical protein